MSDYISREAAVDAMRKIHNPNTARAVMSVVALRELPAADVMEVRHGSDIYSAVRGHCEFKCSLCGADALVVEGGKLDGGKFNYCPNCGAKMDGGDHDAVD